ncbi:HAMP domain-containing histidine kinase [Candidatus Woesearchaeota archaeon]|nr:HAMP domain-containing histidine kinase [Candidatus Woesearchaeota archaeon]
MVAAKIETPVLNSITFRYLLAHAERPSLLADSSTPALQRLSRLPPFYEEFVDAVASQVPGYDEAALLTPGTMIPQKDFKAVLACFKRITGINNPLDYPHLGRVIPAVQDSLTLLGAMAAGPAVVISQSPGYNHKFNNDQRVAVEKLDQKKNRVEARIEHYLLPSSEVHYLEMVTAALGYWEGIPRLWQWPEWGSTNLFEIQIPLDELVARDYTYLGLHYKEDKGVVFINGKAIGIKFSFANDPDRILGYTPIEGFLTSSLLDYQPVQVNEDVTINGEVIFPGGVKYGMPCNRYDVSVPHPTLGKRLLFAWAKLFKYGSSEEDNYRFLQRKPSEVVLADEICVHQRDVIAKIRAEGDAVVLRGKLETLNREHLARYGAQMRRIQEKRLGAHHIQNHLGVALDCAYKALVQELRVHGSGDVAIPPGFVTEPRILRPFLEDLSVNSINVENPMTSIPEPVYTAALLTQEIEHGLKKAHAIMKEADDALQAAKIPKERFFYRPLLEKVVTLVNRMNSGLGAELSIDVPSDVEIYAHSDLLERALQNLLDNAVQASQRGAVVISTRIDRRPKADYLTTIITQSGDLSPRTAFELSRGKAVATTKGENGNGVGAMASYDIVKDKHDGIIQYHSFGGGKGGEIVFSIPLPRDL